MTSEENNPEESLQEECIQEEGSETNTTCMICMEEWTIGSDHRVCCLKCGHLFGRSCIERWIKEKGAANAKCPTCNKPAKKADLRDLWCKAIKATDTTELSQLQQTLENERKLRKTDAAIIFHQNLRLEMVQGEMDKLKKTIIERDAKITKLEGILDRYNKLRAQKLASNDADINIQDLMALEDPEVEVDVDVEPVEMKGSFYLVERVESSSTGGCRSFALCPTASLILLAQSAPLSTRTIFGGYGLRKFSTIDTNIREFIPLHAKPITSMQLKPLGDLILTSSQDKKVRLTSISNNTCIQSYQCQNEPTCVSWSAHRDQQFYVASGNCFVTLYDMRNTSEHIYQTNRKVANSRLLSIASTSSPGDLHGVLVNDCKGAQWLEISENSCYEMETIDQSMEHLTGYQLPFEGLMGTVDFNKRLDMALISTRRTRLTPQNAHNLVRLKKIQTEDGTFKMDCQRIRTFYGGRTELLGHSRILKHPTLDQHVLVGACDVEEGGLKLWDSSDNKVYQSLKTQVFVRDMVMYSPPNTNNHILYTLSDNGLTIFKWDYA